MRSWPDYARHRPTKARTYTVGDVRPAMGRFPRKCQSLPSCGQHADKQGDVLGPGMKKVAHVQGYPCSFRPEHLLHPLAKIIQASGPLQLPTAIFNGNLRIAWSA